MRISTPQIFMDVMHASCKGSTVKVDVLEGVIAANFSRQEFYFGAAKSSHVKKKTGKSIPVFLHRHMIQGQIRGGWKQVTQWR